jgi:hypothetical protein
MSSLDSTSSNLKSKDINTQKEIIIQKYLPTYPYITTKEIDLALEKATLEEDQKKSIKNLLSKDAKEAIQYIKKSDYRKKYFQFTLLILMLSFSIAFFFSIMGINSLSIFISFLAFAYWIFLIFLTKLNLFELINQAVSNSKIIYKFIYSIYFLKMTGYTKEIKKNNQYLIKRNQNLMEEIDELKIEIDKQQMDDGSKRIEALSTEDVSKNMKELRDIREKRINFRL